MLLCLMRRVTDVLACLRTSSANSLSLQLPMQATGCVHSGLLLLFWHDTGTIMCFQFILAPHTTAELQSVQLPAVVPPQDSP
jgi:hypothetical protein